MEIVKSLTNLLVQDCGDPSKIRKLVLSVYNHPVKESILLLEGSKRSLFGKITVNTLQDSEAVMQFEYPLCIRLFNYDGTIPDLIKKEFAMVVWKLYSSFLDDLIRTYSED